MMKMRKPARSKGFGFNPFEPESKPVFTDADKKAFSRSLFLLVVRLYENKNYAQALRLIDYLLRTQEPVAEYYKVAGFILQAENRCVEALEFFAKAENADQGDDAQLFLSQGQCHMMLGDFISAQKSLELAKENLKTNSQRSRLEKVVLPLLERAQEINSNK